MIVSRFESSGTDERFIGESAAMRRIFQAIRKVSATDVTVLIQGESGTGKELVASEIHRRSARSGGPWVAVNCGAIPESLLDSELFGYERGAFTDAKERRRGRFELANRGTLFLDEIGELTGPAQVRLLRALDAKPVMPLGGEKALSLNVRFIAATNRCLEEEVRNGRFRGDLFWRLNVFAIQLPPLRQRREDIPLLVDHFIEQAARKHGLPPREPEPAALAALLGYSWPGNVRELRSVIECALITCENGLIRCGDLSPRVRGEAVAPNGSSSGHGAKGLENGLSLSDAVQQAQSAVEVRMIREALEATSGNRTRAAERLGITRRTLFNKLRELGIEN
jgi:DNA-binding NtrC family response regulator